MALTDNLVSYWKLDEASGNALDAHGSNDLTDINTVGSATGKISNARDFDAASAERFTITDNATLSGADVDRTFAFWMHPDSLAATRAPAGKFAGGGQQEFRFQIATTGLLAFQVSGSGTSSVGANTPSSTISAGSWYYVVGWHDSVANTINLQVNNGTVYSAAHSTGMFNGTAPFTIGCWSAGAEPFDGLIDEFGWWDRVLTSDERTELYNSGNGLSYDDFAGGGPTEYTRSVEGNQPAATGALTRIYQAVRSLAGGQPASSGTLSRTLAALRAVAGSQPASSGTLSRTLAALRALAGNQPASTGTLGGLTVFLRSLAGSMPAATGALSRTYQALRSLAGSQPASSGVLARTAGAFARVLTGSQPAASGALSRTLAALRALAGNMAAAVGALTAEDTSGITTATRATVSDSAYWGASAGDAAYAGAAASDSEG